MASKDYYQTLGISKSASPDEVKKAFRKLAHQHHPDKHGGSDAKFKEINEAYQVLSDSQKRQQYDQFGANFESAGGPGGFNWQDFARAQQGGFNQSNVNFDFGDIGDLFGDFFGGGAGRRSRRAGPRRGADVEFVTAIDFREAVFGVEKVLRFEKSIVCNHCKGSGAEPGAKINTCSTCGGAGQVEQMQRTFLGAMRTVAVCPTCGGEGKSAEKACTHCHGKGSEVGVRELKVQIPAGIDNGQAIRLSGEGEPGVKSGPAGDLHLIVQVRPDKLFKREGYNLTTAREISMSLASLGGKVKLATLDGDIYLKIPAGTQSGKIFKLESKGVPHLRGKNRGDILVTIYVKTPEKLSKKEKESIRALPKLAGEEIDDFGWF
jgi:molecular chaperone DnaJ